MHARGLAPSVTRVAICVSLVLLDGLQKKRETALSLTDLGRENSACHLKIQTGKTEAFHFSYHSHALITLYVQFLCSDWSKFDRWVHAENLYSILKLVYFDSWSWQSFLSTCDVFWMHKMKYSCYQQSSVIHGWFVHWIFGWEMRRLSKSEIRFLMTSLSFFTLLDVGWKVPQAILALLDSFQELHLEW